MLDRKKLTSSRWPHVPNEHWGRAQEMRREPTQAEHLLWQVLRHKRLGVQFRRQHPIGPYIADFFCDDFKLVIEVDGDVHDDPQQHEHDQAKDAYLTTCGLHVLRFRNEDVIESLDAVVSKIEALVRR